MNVTPQVGNLFDSPAQTLTNTVNCVGVMGKGIALQFKQRFPDMFREYAECCRRGEVRLGRPYLWTPLMGPWVLNFPTKDHWRAQTKLDDLVAGLEYLAAHYRAWGITSLAVPPLGCGEGGLEWRIVGPTLYRHLSRLNVPVDLFAPYGTPPDQLEHAFLGHGTSETPGNVRVSPAAIAIAEIVRRLHEQPYSSAIGRIAFQKIAYFVTESGIPTGLEYREGSFGPYADELKTLKRKLVNNGVLIERQVGQAFVSEPGPTFADASQLYRSHLDQWEHQIEAITDLFMRLRSTRLVEVAATIHYAAGELRRQRGGQPTEFDVLTYVRKWKERRQPPLTDEELSLAIRNLNALGWLHLEPSPTLPMRV